MKKAKPVRGIQVSRGGGPWHASVKCSSCRGRWSVNRYDGGFKFCPHCGSFLEKTTVLPPLDKAWHAVLEACRKKNSAVMESQAVRYRVDRVNEFDPAWRPHREFFGQQRHWVVSDWKAAIDPEDCCIKTAYRLVAMTPRGEKTVLGPVVVEPKEAPVEF